MTASIDIGDNAHMRGNRPEEGDMGAVKRLSPQRKNPAIKRALKAISWHFRDS